MRKIHRIIHNLKDELCSSKEYAEKYVEKKVEGNNAWANRYREMSNDELNHAAYIYDLLNEKVRDISNVYKMKEEDEELVEKWHRKYAEFTALIKQMLSI